MSLEEDKKIIEKVVGKKYVKTFKKSKPLNIEVTNAMNMDSKKINPLPSLNKHKHKENTKKWDKNDWMSFMKIFKNSEISTPKKNNSSPSDHNFKHTFSHFYVIPLL